MKQDAEWGGDILKRRSPPRGKVLKGNSLRAKFD